MSDEITVSSMEGDQSSNSNEDQQPLSPMQKRINAVKVLTARLEKINAEHHQEVHQLEVKHDRLVQEILEKRSSILSGEYEPTEDESIYLSDDGKELDPYREFPKYDAKIKGVPKFWLTVLKNSKKVAEYIQDHDEPVLAHLQDIKLKVSENPMGFSLEFHFSKNEYFTNKVLTKQYEKNTEPSSEELYSLEVPEIRACKGCKINWKEGKNVTLKITRTVTPISTTKVKTVTEMIQRESFFTFFSLPAIPSNLLREKFEKQRLRLIIEDSVLGLHIKNKVIPKAVFYYTGRRSDLEEEEEGEEDHHRKDPEEMDLSCNII